MSLGLVHVHIGLCLTSSKTQIVFSSEGSLIVISTLSLQSGSVVTLTFTLPVYTVSVLLHVHIRVKKILELIILSMSLYVRKPTRSDTNRPVQ